MKAMVRLLALCSGLLIAGGAAAQSAATSATAHYPNHPVRVLVGFTAAGPTDVIARYLGHALLVRLAASAADINDQRGG